MKTLTAGANDAGQRVDRLLSRTYKNLPPALIYKYLRLKRIKLNGGRAKPEDRLREGDVLELYVNDELLDSPPPEQAFLTLRHPPEIVYEDRNILIMDKRPGLLSQPDGGETDSLEGRMLKHLHDKGEYSPDRENAFVPSLCNRIDRGTGGLVIAAKNAEALRIMNEKIKNREVSKYYLCIVRGEPSPKEGELRHYLLKDEAKRRVLVCPKGTPGARLAVTRYQVLMSRGGESLVECRLITGRTHQIRAQLSEIGHPLLGDGKYGRNEYNRGSGHTRQALYSYRLRFDFTSESGILSYLTGREFSAPRVDFAEEFRQNRP